MRLISMTEFVLEQGLNPLQNDIEAWRKTHNYAEFLKLKLELWMFVPCDSEGNVLEEPLRIHFNTDFDYKAELDVYNESLNKVVFDGFNLEFDVPNNYVTNGSFYPLLNENNKIIEDLVKCNLELTPTVLKQLGL